MQMNKMLMFIYFPKCLTYELWKLKLTHEECLIPNFQRINTQGDIQYDRIFKHIHLHR